MVRKSDKDSQNGVGGKGSGGGRITMVRVARGDGGSLGRGGRGEGGVTWYLRSNMMVNVQVAAAYGGAIGLAAEGR
jgi:hypothetical protein